MKRALIPMLLLIAATANAGVLRETVEKSFPVRPRSNVSVSTVNGRVTVRAWNESRVVVRAEKQVNSRDEDAARKVLRELRVDMQQTGDQLTINTIQPKKESGFGIWDFLLGTEVDSQVRYELSVPREMNVSLRTVNGSINLGGVTGQLEVDTTNGRIEITQCAGSLNASTTNGGVHAEFTHVTPGKGIRIETTNGRIEIALPASLAADVDAGTTNGKIESDLTLALRSSSSNRLRGSLNGGGTSVRLRTTNGSIQIHSNGTAERASR